MYNRVQKYKVQSRNCKVKGYKVLKSEGTFTKPVGLEKIINKYRQIDRQDDGQESGLEIYTRKMTRIVLSEINIQSTCCLKIYAT